MPGSEDRIANLLERDFDYVVGSVHFLGPRGAVDDRRYDVWEEIGDPDEVWVGLLPLAGGARTLGPLRHRLASRPGEDLGFRSRPAPSAIPASTTSRSSRRSSESGIAVEISTAGLRKPVGEIYPARALAEMCVEAGADFALSSDAHAPDQVGFGYDGAIELLSLARASSGSASSRAASAASSRSAAPGRRCRQVTNSGEAGDVMALRVGIGYDSHRLVEGERLVIGGVEIEHDRGLGGHSDADVLTHAVIDALLGACCARRPRRALPRRRGAVARRRLDRPAPDRRRPPVRARSPTSTRP